MQSSQRRCSPEGQRNGVYSLNQNYSYTPAWHAIQPDTKLARGPKAVIYPLGQNYAFSQTWHVIQPDMKLARTPKNVIFLIGQNYAYTPARYDARQKAKKRDLLRRVGQNEPNRPTFLCHMRQITKRSIALSSILRLLQSHPRGKERNVLSKEERSRWQEEGVEEPKVEES